MEPTPHAHPTMLDLSSQEAPTLITIDEDSLTIILGYMMSLNDIGACASTCHHFSRLCRTEAFWWHICTTLWPSLPPRALPGAPAADTNDCDCSSWREVARRRGGQPHWRHGRMDEIEHMIYTFKADDGDKLASLVCGVFAGGYIPTKHGVEGLVWTHELTSAMLSTSHETLSELKKWAVRCEARLDEFYENGHGSAPERMKALREVLLKALRGASALRFLLDHCILNCDRSTDTTAAWQRAGLPDALSALTSGLASLELEGFNVAVPPSQCPGKMPSSHAWWGAKVFILPPR